MDEMPKGKDPSIGSARHVRVVGQEKGERRKAQYGVLRYVKSDSLVLWACSAIRPFTFHTCIYTYTHQTRSARHTPSFKPTPGLLGNGYLLLPQPKANRLHLFRPPHGLSNYRISRPVSCWIKFPLLGEVEAVKQMHITFTLRSSLDDEDNIPCLPRTTSRVITCSISRDQRESTRQLQRIPNPEWGIYPIGSGSFTEAGYKLFCVLVRFFIRTFGEFLE
ncbi:hypothetical protein V8F20_008463 [Naviculisporaceae sp. PSN 640]